MLQPCLSVHVLVCDPCSEQVLQAVQSQDGMHIPPPEPRSTSCCITSGGGAITVTNIDCVLFSVSFVPVAL